MSPFCRTVFDTKETFDFWLSCDLETNRTKHLESPVQTKAYVQANLAQNTSGWSVENFHFLKVLPALSTDAVKVITDYFMLCPIAERNIDSCKVDLSTQVTYMDSQL